MKNIDKIRQMTADELAELISSDCAYCSYSHLGCLCEGNCKEYIKDWLEQESEE